MQKATYEKILYRFTLIYVIIKFCKNTSFSSLGKNNFCCTFFEGMRK